MAEEKEPPLEKVIERLETIVEKLESGEVALEKSIDLYEEGRLLGAKCLERLAKLEKRVHLVMENGTGGLQTKPFDEAETEQS